MPEWPRGLNEEMRQHLDDEYEALRERGFTDDEALRALAVEAEEASSLSARPVDALAADLCYALRSLRKSPGFTAIVTLTLALGIGATTAIFTVVDAVMLRPFPYPDMERIMILREAIRGGGQQVSVSWPNFQDWRDQNQVFDRFGLYRPMVMNLTGGDRPERVISSAVSSEVFGAIGIQPALGRAFVSAEDKPGAPRAVVISDRFWRAHFDGDREAIGRAITLDGDAHTIVGVMPPEMRFPSRLTDAWLPLGPYVPTFPAERGNHPGLTVVARLKPAVTVARAAADMDAIARRLERQYPSSNTDHTVLVQPYYEQIVENIRPALVTLSAAVVFVLLISCANLANLMLARSDSRQREIAIRAAMGASRRRIFQQLLTESMAMSVGGGALGILVAWRSVRTFVAMQPTSVPRIDQVAVDARVLAFALGVSVATGVAFGIAPAFRGATMDFVTSLKDAARATPASGRRMRSVLVIAEVALALVLLAGAGLTVRSFANLTAIELGFDESRVVTMHASLPDTRYRDVAQWTAFHRELVGRVSAIPGLDAVGLNSAVPLAGMGAEAEVRYEGQPPRASAHEEGTAALYQAVTPDYFRAMGMPILRGRAFTERDTAETVRVAIVEEALVRKFFPNADPIGKRIAFEFIGGHAPGATPIWREIVGVVKHVRHYGLVREPPNLQVYAALEQPPLWFANRRPTMTLFARTSLEPDKVIASVRRAVADIDPDVPVFGLQTMEQYVDQATEQSRLSMALLSAFGALALVLAGLGIYGVLSFLVGRRMQEIGIRLALGATRADVMRLVLVHGMKLAAAGMAIGVAAALLVTQALRSTLVGVSPHDPGTYAAIVAVLCAIALGASCVPGVRAMRVDPMSVLNRE